jgi:hypothetical protein
MQTNTIWNPSPNGAKSSAQGIALCKNDDCDSQPQRGVIKKKIISVHPKKILLFTASNKEVLIHPLSFLS